MKEKIKADEALLANATAAHDAFRETVEHWTEGLVDAAAAFDEHLQPSAKLNLFFKRVATALQRLREKIRKQLADESRKICAGALQKVLMEVAFRNPGLNFTNVLKSLPPDAAWKHSRPLSHPLWTR